jgi:hypothetical protein
MGEAMRRASRFHGVAVPRVPIAMRARLSRHKLTNPEPLALMRCRSQRTRPASGNASYDSHTIARLSAEPEAVQLHALRRAAAAAGAPRDATGLNRSLVRRILGDDFS